MSIIQPAPSFQPTGTAVAPPPRRLPPRWAGEHSLGLDLVRDGLVPAHVLVAALSLQRRHGGRLEDILRAQGQVPDRVLAGALARHHGQRLVDPLAAPPDPRLIDRLGAETCLREGLLPWQAAGGATVVLAAHPEVFARNQGLLAARFGPVVPAMAAPAAIEAAVLAVRGAALARAAETRTPEPMSCRIFAAGALPLRAALLLMALSFGLWLAPALMALALTVWVALMLLAVTGLKAAALCAALRPAPPEPPAPTIARLPVVSVMVPLYREASIAARLVRRLERLDYPRALLDILLVVEAEDWLTRTSLDGAGLPHWMRVVIAPPGSVKTKPRALNYALGLCRGAIVGVYDAEDAPAPDQIRRVVARFHARGPEVACLQGVLDYDHPRRNWMSRCFTMEYAGWFRVLLPGISRLGLPVPLGGTTLFFRRPALEALGAWDAHNVTEDADLGIRLHRAGYRTELIDTVTTEEPNCRPIAWVKQRSRWIKGYIVTWAVHMRDPVALWRDLGPRGFLGFQILFLATLSQFLLAPLLWTFWTVPFGLPHPVAHGLPVWALYGIGALFAVTEIVALAVGWLGLRRRGGGVSPLWLPTLHLYFPLAAVASYKAFWEIIFRPFYWDKTAHGLLSGP